MAKVKAWKQGATGEPYFPDEFEVSRKAVLQVTDIRSNHNKYYCLELHRAWEGGRGYFRVFTHYGRTGDLERNPDAGAREARYLANSAEAEAEYARLYRQKTSRRKGYQEVNLAASNIGSRRSRGSSSGRIDAKTLRRMVDQRARARKRRRSALAKSVQDLVGWLYEEATHALTLAADVQITAKGIETPLGVLTIGQVERGEAILRQARALYHERELSAAAKHELLERLSGEFYSIVPHRLGRSRAAVRAAVLDDPSTFEEKRETLQLMKDMLSVNGDANVLLAPEVDKKYGALGCRIKPVPRRSEFYGHVARYVAHCPLGRPPVKLKAVFAIRRDAEWEAFDEGLGNLQLLYHGSRAGNWLGIVSRGVLLPTVAEDLGIERTDAGRLGYGIYFGAAVRTAAQYTTATRRATRLISLHRVALGRAKPFTKVRWGLSKPPRGYQSCHGVGRHARPRSEFAEDEFVIYRREQQRQEYLVEIEL